MVKGGIGVIDSGIGGLNVLKKIYSRVRGETFVYFGDNENVPYGNKSDGELLNLALSAVLRLSEYGVKCIVIGCNTLSLAVGEKIRELSGVPVFPVFPPVEKESARGRKSVLIGTERTCEKYRETEKLKIVPMKSLAREIEENRFSLEKSAFGFETDICGIKADAVILGCTHYEYIERKILDHFNAEVAVSGTDYTAAAVLKWLKEAKPQKKTGDNNIIFIGDSKNYNKSFWENVVIKTENIVY